MQRFAVFSLLFAAFAALGCASTTAHPQTLSLDGALANKYVRSGVSGDVTARIVIASHTPKEIDKPPVSLALVIDTSGSMDGKPIACARSASLALITSLTRRDRLALVTFNSRAEVLMPMTKLGDVDMVDLKRKIESMKAEGTTDMEHGLEAGIAEVSRDLDASAVNRVVLLGDGVPNVEASIRSQAAQAGARGISITTLGLGADYDETLMGQVAQASGGRFHYVDDSSKIAQFFGDEVNRLKRAEARNATLDLTPGPGVTIQSVVGQSWSPTNSGVRVALGDMSRGESRELVVKLVATSHRNGAAVEVMDAVLHYGSATSEGPELEQRLFLGARAVADDSDLESGKNKDVESAATRVQAAADTLEAIRLARAGDVPGAQRAIDSVNQNAPATDEKTRRARKELNDALPTLAPDPVTTPRPAPAAQKPAPPVVRSMHDAAMKTLQNE